MSVQAAASRPQALPQRPSLEHLKNQARRRLRELRASSAGAKLADAQLQVARNYGFPSWPALKASVERMRAPAPPLANLAGFYSHDQAVVRNGMATIVCDGDQVFLEAPTGARFELRAQEDGRFGIAGMDGSFSFEGGQAGPATALISHTRMGDGRLPRISPAEAEAIRLAYAEADADQKRPRTQVAVSPDSLRRYVGHYASPLGPAMIVACRDGRLFAQVVGQPEFEVFPESETRFFFTITPAQLAFTLQGDEVAGLILHQAGMEQRLDRVSAEAAERSTAGIRARLAEQQRPRTAVGIDPGVLGRYVGRYKMDAGRVLAVTAEDGRLFVEATGQPRFEVYPESDDTFFWTVVAAQITFAADGDGRVTHAVLHQAGRDVPFSRLEDETLQP